MRKKEEVNLSLYMTLSWKLAKLYNKCFVEAQQKYNLTINERDVLLFLQNNKGYDTAADIVKYRSISKSLVSKSIDSLTKRGYLASKRTENDLRQVHLQITAEAGAAVRQLTKIQNAFFYIIGEGLSEEERRIFNKVFKKIEYNADHYSNKEV